MGDRDHSGREMKPAAQACLLPLSRSAKYPGQEPGERNRWKTNYPATEATSSSAWADRDRCLSQQPAAARSLLLNCPVKYRGRALGARNPWRKKVMSSLAQADRNRRLPAPEYCQRWKQSKSGHLHCRSTATTPASRWTANGATREVQNHRSSAMALSSSPAWQLAAQPWCRRRLAAASIVPPRPRFR